jgi:hypothetical protein
MEDFMKNYTAQLRKKLVGKKIIAIRYMTDSEMAQQGWYSKPLIIQLDDNTFIVPQSDDEGNNGGALALINGQDYTLVPVTHKG